MNLPMMSLAVLLIAGAPVAVAQDLESAFQKLQEAEGKKDIALLKTTAVETCALARQAIAAPAPQDAAEKEAWSAGVARARSIQLRAEYALYAAAVQAPPATAIELLSAIEKENPKSKYLDEGYGFYLSALNQTGQAKNIPAIAEKAIVNLPENEDLLAYLADTALSRKQSDRAAGYAERLIAVDEQASQTGGRRRRRLGTQAGHRAGPGPLDRRHRA